ncbi:Mediator of RNA polymerase II transcription subunit 17 [Aphelenchoides fujianensis]|nr:Mediator of RNA polymerase II transcription subunit 17 [Aphelenchoides fujianensis]
MFRNLQLVSLDVTNTLIKFRRHPAAVYVEFAKRFGFAVDRAAVWAAFPQAFKQLEAAEPCFGLRTGGPIEWWTEVMRRCFGPRIAEDARFPELTREIFDHFGRAAAWELTSEENARVVRAIRERGVKTAIISNFDSRLHGILDELRLSALFDRVFISGEVGHQKPDGEIFRHVLEQLGVVDPAAAVHVSDDLRKDFKGARAVGMNALLVSEVPLLEVPREHQISSLNQLERVMQQEGGERPAYAPAFADDAQEPDGVKVAVESPFEWQIDFIGYDGNEAYIRPPEFVDVVSKNINKIPWQTIVDKAPLLDAADGEDEEADEKKQIERELRVFDSIRDAAREKLTPAAGPWAAVAKSLYESMQEVDVLLDTLRIAKKPLGIPGTSETYMDVQQVSQVHEEHRTMEAATRSKVFWWVSRRKAFEEALKILHTTTTVRNSTKASENSKYFEELKSLRENWRIRKINDLVFGDLGYRTYGPKFQQPDIFDIYWNPKSKLKRGGCIEVQIPKNLMRRTFLSVSLLKDTAENQNEIAEPAATNQFSAFADTSRNIPWEQALKWAQDSLINGDMFTQLLRESAAVRNICIVTENAIAVCLVDGMLLKFERYFFPLDEFDPPESTDSYLTSLIRQFFVADLLKPPQRAQTFVGFPTTHLPESLDFRGPNGMPAEEIASRVERPSTLLQRMIRAANHYILTDQVLEVLSQYTLCRDYSGAHLSWHWLRCTSTFSMISANFTNQGYENLGKAMFMLHIYENEVHVITKDYATVNCHRQMTVLQENLSLMSSNCQLLATTILGKTYGWHVLHANSNAFCKEGTPAPSFYSSNQYANKKLFVQFFTDGRPSAVFMKRTPLAANGTHAAEQPPEDGVKREPAEEPMETNETDDFTPINCERIPGSSLMKKLEFLFTIFRT